MNGTNSGFSVTFQVVTPESAENGDIDRAGFIVEGVRLFEAKRALQYAGDALKANCWPASIASAPRWITFADELDHATGEVKTVSLHFPRKITPASAMRVARLFGLHS